MKTAVASAMILFLVSVAALCPLIACPLTADSQAPSGCCHKRQTKTIPDCPYSILQKSKTNATATGAQWVDAIVHVERHAALPLAGHTADVPCRLVDVSGLFLRNRVLLI